MDNLATYETTIEMPSKGQRARFWWVDVCDSSRQRCEVERERDRGTNDQGKKGYENHFDSLGTFANLFATFPT